MLPAQISGFAAFRDRDGQRIFIPLDSVVRVRETEYGVDVFTSDGLRQSLSELESDRLAKKLEVAFEAARTGALGGRVVRHFMPAELRRLADR
ncbi:MAG TPA: hypothetical protein VJ783_32230 [Pirellulales bacterium]|nr:hypothetical protein [Pirellulales bacterium]